MEDIVPPATEIFNEVGIIALPNFIGETATITIVNIDNPDEVIVFAAPFNQIEPIVSNNGKQVTNAMQTLGSSITYMRRYLYMIALDICEPDSIDNGISNNPPVVKVEAKTAQATSLTDSNSNASDLQIKQLKELLKKLREFNPDTEDYIAEIAVATKGFTVISKAECEDIVTNVTQMLNGGEE